MKARTFVWLLLAGGCSSESVNEEAFCRALAEAECGAVKGHCEVADEGACVIHREFDCQVVTRKQQTSSKGFNAVGAGACLTKVRAVYAKAVISALELREVDRSCMNLYWGQRARGEPCMFDRECQGQNTCREQVCTSPFPAPGCGLTGQVCAKGTVCEGFSQAQGGPTCIPLPAAGMPCTRQSLCADDARCDRGTCVARLPVGGECLKDDECQQPSALCDPATLVCATGFAVTPQTSFCEPFRRERPADAAPRSDVGPRGDAREASVDASSGTADAGGDTADAPVDAVDANVGANVDAALDADVDAGGAGSDRPD